MTVRAQIEAQLAQLFEEDELEIPQFVDDMVLLDSDLDSLGYAVLVTRMEDELGYDPFSLMDDPVYPTTFGELVEIYERFADRAR